MNILFEEWNFDFYGILTVPKLLGLSQSNQLLTNGANQADLISDNQHFFIHFSLLNKTFI